MRILFSFFLLGLLGLVQALSATGSRLLVVLEEASEKALYAQFWADLEERGFKLSFESPKNDQLSLFKHGGLAYDHLILAPPKSKGYGPALAPKLLLDFTNAGGNILLGLSPATPSAISSLLLELDIHISPDRSAVVVDHFNYDAATASEEHDVLMVGGPPPLRPDVKTFFTGRGVLAVPRAVGQILGNNSPLLAPILKAPDTAYIHNPKDDAEDEPFATGTQISLVSAMQARNSARFTVLGSLEMFQDKWFNAVLKPATTTKPPMHKSANREFAKQLTEWTFKEVGVLKVGEITHYETKSSSKSSSNSTQIGSLNPTIYRIKNDVTFSIELSEYAQTHWTPFSLPSADSLQLEFSMLSPFLRLPLLPTSTSANYTTYSTSFTLPDQHGIFAFKVNYKRPFITSIEEKRQVTVRHFAHDEWPRSWAISGAWPWIGGMWSVVGGFLAFVAIWLYCEPPGEASGRLRSLSQGKI